MLRAFPALQLFFRQRFEEVIGNDDLPLEDIGLPLAPGLAGNEACNRFSPARDQNLLARLDLREESRKLGLGLMDIDGRHDVHPEYRQSS